MTNYPNLDKITVVILAKNEADGIANCLDALSDFPRVLVVDTGSTDATRDIVATYPVTLVRYPFTTFRDVRLHALSLITTEWVFFLDADEHPSPGLIAALDTLVVGTDVDGLAVPRRNIFVGQWMAHSGWYPDYQFRIARVNTIGFETQQVHERMTSTGYVDVAAETAGLYITHHTCKTLTSYISKLNHYTQLEAQDRANDPAFKTSVWAILSRSVGMFTQTLFHFKGRRDGKRGTILALINMVYSILLMIKIWEIREGAAAPPPAEPHH